MQSTATTIDGYLDELPAERRSALSTIRTLIHRVAPGTIEEMKYGMPAFRGLCALASQKQYMALYVCEHDVVKAYQVKLGKIDCGKGCIRFKRLADLNLDAVEHLLREVIRLQKQGMMHEVRNEATGG